MIILDASAIIAWLRQEPGADQVDAALQNDAVISAVNFAEVLSKVGERGGDVRAAARDLRIEGLQVELMCRTHAPWCLPALTAECAAGDWWVPQAP
ncbi:PIN domain-containing protein [Deinococcus sp. QL22]|uniref:PIN domain-containing protein n=1 Tax=Deinococcus sp. QL22 TaxID=2939437 RepID=UPI00201832D4|nr:PIN domain-containing protein [Deinococcus sp. QL22]UQN09484.1 PIN domain-containing protein [Deinococcus sp. QL22]